MQSTISNQLSEIILATESVKVCSEEEYQVKQGNPKIEKLIDSLIKSLGGESLSIFQRLVSHIDMLENDKDSYRYMKNLFADIEQS